MLHLCVALSSYKYTQLNMVRNIIGTVVKVGNGRISPAEFAEIVQSRDRNKAGKTAPAAGLTLWQVYY
ncbi:hypothetical protein [Pectinatus cerevisiiphilus]|uniref:hypothetical protein n=1 Tax=Pectinatus cerevisiiphilus TaxID=86956 RepID=UPI0010471DAC